MAYNSGMDDIKCGASLSCFPSHDPLKIEAAIVNLHRLCLIADNR